MRPIWKGTIAFGLVNIPVALYPAARPGHEIKFRLLRGSDLSPIRYKRIAEADAQEVSNDKIVKGFEYERGQFVVISDEDFERVNVKANRTVEILEFVDLNEIDPLFFEKPYYLVPEKGGEKAYGLLREALRKTNKVGIAKVVLRTREYLAAVKPLNQALVLEMMHFADEIASPADFNIPEKMELGKKELEMAEMLIQSMTSAWEPGKYQDEFEAALMKVIQEKVSGGKLPAPQRAAAPVNVVNLMEVLQQSLERAKTAAPKKRKTAKSEKKAASA